MPINVVAIGPYHGGPPTKASANADFLMYMAETSGGEYREVKNLRDYER
jgi:hypothetical protein